MCVILIRSNMFTDWQLNFSCFFLCWPLNSLELFSNAPRWFFCYPIGHSCTRPSIKIAKVIICFSVITTKKWELLNTCCAKGKLVLRWLALFVSLYSSVWVHILFLVLDVTFRTLGQQLSVLSCQCNSSERCLTMLRDTKGKSTSVVWSTVY